MLVQFRIDRVLHLVCVCLRAERGLNALVVLCVEAADALLDVLSFASAGCAADQRVLAVSHQQVEQVAVANCIDGGHDDVLHTRQEILGN